MSNVVSFKPKEGTLAAVSDMQTALRAATIEAGQGSTTMPILRLLRDGTWAYGSDNVEPEEGSRWACNPFSLQHGYICWGDEANLLGEIMLPLGQARPAKPSLPAQEFPWNDQFSVDMVCVDGDDEGQAVIFKPSSVGGRRAMSVLMTAISTQLAAEGPEGKIVPLVKLTNDSYAHKKYGRIYNPILEITDWVGVGESEAPAKAEPETEEKPASRRRRRKPA